MGYTKQQAEDFKKAFGKTFGTRSKLFLADHTADDPFKMDPKLIREAPSKIDLALFEPSFRGDSMKIVTCGQGSKEHSGVRTELMLEVPTTYISGFGNPKRAKWALSLMNMLKRYPWEEDEGLVINDTLEQLDGCRPNDTLKYALISVPFRSLDQSDCLMLDIPSIGIIQIWQVIMITAEELQYLKKSEDPQKCFDILEGIKKQGTTPLDFDRKSCVEAGELK